MVMIKEAPLTLSLLQLNHWAEKATLGIAQEAHVEEFAIDSVHPLPELFAVVTNFDVRSGGSHRSDRIDREAYSILYFPHRACDDFPLFFREAALPDPALRPSLKLKCFDRFRVRKEKPDLY